MSSPFTESINSANVRRQHFGGELHKRNECASAHSSSMLPVSTSCEQKWKAVMTHQIASKAKSEVRGRI